MAELHDTRLPHLIQKACAQQDWPVGFAESPDFAKNIFKNFTGNKNPGTLFGAIAGPCWNNCKKNLQLVIIMASLVTVASVRVTGSSTSPANINLHRFFGP